MGILLFKRRAEKGTLGLTKEQRWKGGWPRPQLEKASGKGWNSLKKELRGGCWRFGGGEWGGLLCGYRRVTNRERKHVLLFEKKRGHATGKGTLGRLKINNKKKRTVKFLTQMIAKTSKSVAACRGD